MAKADLLQQNAWLYILPYCVSVFQFPVVDPSSQPHIMSRRPRSRSVGDLHRPRASTGNSSATASPIVVILRTSNGPRKMCGKCLSRTPRLTLPWSRTSWNSPSTWSRSRSSIPRDMDLVPRWKSRPMKGVSFNSAHVDKHKFRHVLKCLLPLECNDGTSTSSGEGHCLHRRVFHVCSSVKLKLAKDWRDRDPSVFPMSGGAGNYHPKLGFYFVPPNLEWTNVQCWAWKIGPNSLHESCSYTSGSWPSSHVLVRPWVIVWPQEMVWNSILVH